MAAEVFGLSPIPHPSKPDAELRLDIVLVHEFGGHAARTWESLWIKGDVSTEWPDARVLTFGYNETSRHPYGRKELSSHVEKLLWELYKERTDKYARLRPLVFIGRGAGGIIIKKALITARCQTRYRDIFSLTLGAVFFGTPHQCAPGSWQQVVSKMFQEDPLNRHLDIEMPDDLLRDGDDAAGLTEISEAFVRIPGIFVISDTPVIMNSNVQAALRPTVADFRTRGLDPSLKPGLLLGLTTWIVEKSPKATKGALSGEYSQVLRLLRPRKVRRENTPTPPTPGTCSWIEEKPEFFDWRRRAPGERLLWIRGDMGCGKTYLARHIVRLIADPRAAGNRPETVAYCSLGDIVDGYKTPQSVLAWLLHEVLIAHPGLVPGTKLKDGMSPVCDSTFPEVQKLWRSVIVEATSGNNLLSLVIDDLDQLHLEPDDLGEFIRGITCDDLPATASGRVRLLVLSRHREQLQAAIAGYGFYRYDISAADTKADIDKTTKEVLNVVKQYPGGSAIAQNIQQQIEQGANGMYLWASIALSEAVKKLHSGNPTMDKLPKGIFPVLDQYLAQCSKGSGSEGNLPRTVLFWMTYQAEPMSGKELEIVCALVEGVGDVRQPEWPELTVDDALMRNFRNRHPNLRREIMNKYGPLVKIDPEGRIGPFHDSLKEYLRMPNNELPQPPALPNHEHYHCDERKANKNISFLCMDYLLQPAFQQPGEEREILGEEPWLDKVNDRIFDHAFVEYAAVHWIYHARMSGTPFVGNVVEWNHLKIPRLLDIRRKGHALWWVEVWWLRRGTTKELPKSDEDLGACFPSLAQPAQDAEFAEESNLLCVVCETVHGDEKALAAEVEDLLGDLLDWMTKLKTDLHTKAERDQQLLEELEKLRNKVSVGSLGDNDAAQMIEDMEGKVERVRAELEAQTKDYDGMRSKYRETKKELNAMKSRYDAMCVSLLGVKQSLERSKGRLEGQKTDRVSWNPFRRSMAAPPSS